jgi:hypothetical protein
MERKFQERSIDHPLFITEWVAIKAGKAGSNLRDT